MQNKLLQLYRCHVEEWVHYQDVIWWESLNAEMMYKQLDMVW